MKALFFFFLMAAPFSSYAASDFPRVPELTITPGLLCSKPIKLRYPEQVAYCGRDVSWQTKDYVINKYDESFGFRIKKLKREDFKIDHLIPLCVGGANEVSNLWPQHKSIYALTDPLEPVLCAKMYEGKLKQSDAVMLVIEAKTHLDRIPAIMRHLESL